MNKKRTFKSFKEFAKDYLKEYDDAYFTGTGGFSIGSLDALKPVADLGPTDRPPDNQGSGYFRGTSVVRPQDTPQKKKKQKDKKEDADRIARKPGQPADSKKHSDLYTDENPKGTIHGLGFVDAETARESVKKIKNSGRSHAHKIQAAIAMSQRAKVASQRAKDEETRKKLRAAHEIYQSYIDKNKKS